MNRWWLIFLFLICATCVTSNHINKRQNPFQNKNIPILNIQDFPVKAEVFSQLRLVPAEASMDIMSVYDPQKLALVAVNRYGSLQEQKIYTELLEKLPTGAASEHKVLLLYAKDSLQASLNLTGKDALVNPRQVPLSVLIEGRAYTPIERKEEKSGKKDKALILTKDQLNELRVQIDEGKMQVYDGRGAFIDVADPQLFEGERNWKFVVGIGENGDMVMRAGDKKSVPADGDKKLHHPSLAGFDDKEQKFLPVWTAGVLEKTEDGVILKMDSGQYGLDIEEQMKKNPLSNSSDFDKYKLQHLEILSDFLRQQGLGHRIQHSSDGWNVIIRRLR